MINALIAAPSGLALVVSVIHLSPVGPWVIPQASVNNSRIRPLSRLHIRLQIRRLLATSNERFIHWWQSLARELSESSRATEYVSTAWLSADRETRVPLGNVALPSQVYTVQSKQLFQKHMSGIFRRQPSLFTQENHSRRRTNKQTKEIFFDPPTHYVCKGQWFC